MGMVSAMNGLVSIDASYWWCIWPEVQFTKHLDLLMSFLEENPEDMGLAVEGLVTFFDLLVILAFELLVLCAALAANSVRSIPLALIG